MTYGPLTVPPPPGPTTAPLPSPAGSKLRETAGGVRPSGEGVRKLLNARGGVGDGSGFRRGAVAAGEDKGRGCADVR